MEGDAMGPINGVTFGLGVNVTDSEFIKILQIGPMPKGLGQMTSQSDEVHCYL